MRSLYAVVVGAMSPTYVTSACRRASKHVSRYRGRLTLFVVVALPLIIAACGGKKGGHGGSWG
jgi:uncharacterized membrane protein